MSFTNNKLYFRYIAVEVDQCQLSGSRASDYELMKIDRKGQITQFVEKPEGSDLQAMVYLQSLNSNISHPFISINVDCEELIN